MTNDIRCLKDQLKELIDAATDADLLDFIYKLLLAEG